MDFKINKETVPVSEAVFGGIQEQSIELDYILPDYCPDIFRLIRCEAVPVITESTVSGGKLNYGLRCDIRILYCGEDGKKIRSISLTKNFNRSAEFSSAVLQPEYVLVPKADHINFRAVNQRRLDIRGAVSVKISVKGTKEQQAVSDAAGMNIQLKKRPVRFVSQKLSTVKSIQLSDETELTAVQPEINEILTVRTNAGDTDIKMVSGKLLAKGEVGIELLYAGSDGIEPLSFSIPYSQMIDLSGLDDSFECNVCAEVVNCDISVPQEGGRTVKCEIELRLVCRAVKTASVMLAEDAFSTVYPCEATVSKIQAEQIPTVYANDFRHTAELTSSEDTPETVYSIWVTPKNINTSVSGSQVTVTGMLTYSMAAKDSSGMMIMPDIDAAFEEIFDLGENMAETVVSAELIPQNVSYNITPDGKLNAKSDITAKISVSGSDFVNVLTDISIDDSVKKKRDGDYAVKLCYCSENEEIWDIAKRYSTSVEAVVAENELDGERLTGGGMILIPIIN